MGGLDPRWDPPRDEDLPHPEDDEYEEDDDGPAWEASPEFLGYEQT